ncbi:Na+/H+ antiporter subunit E [Nocardia asteroides]|uniref:Na+/H+ antiporter subunit E n=1 Tax=Nocardia asteroides TaxID=1824 RepID=UPI001E43197E|nr:Na+/H+ antiporter subunit E [Nocardia asteroides]UGT64772.1 Na+/H+ antiporter subunit E [Nocardia asteroides]
MSRENLGRVGVVLWLALVYTLLWGTLTLGNLVAGLLIGIVIVVVLPLPAMPVTGRFNPIAFAELVAVSTYYALHSSLQVAWLGIRPGSQPVSGVLRVRLDIQSELVLALCVDLLNLIPGTMVLEIDRDRRVVYVHVLDVGSEAAVEQFYRTTRRLERLLVSSFERRPEPETSAEEAKS